MIDLESSLYDIVKKHPIVLELMDELGFKEIKKPGMLQTAGRYMTIPKGAKMKKIPLEAIINRFELEGFTVINK